MQGVGLLSGMLMIWGVLTAVLVVILIYRSRLGVHEDQQLFLDETENLLAREQQEIVHREKRIAPILYALGTVSVVLLLSIVGVWIWRGLGL